MTIAASCKFLGYGTNDTDQEHINTIGNNGTIGRFKIHPLNFANPNT